MAYGSGLQNHLSLVQMKWRREQTLVWTNLEWTQWHCSLCHWCRIKQVDWFVPEGSLTSYWTIIPLSSERLPCIISAHSRLHIYNQHWITGVWNIGALSSQRYRRSRPWIQGRSSVGVTETVTNIVLVQRYRGSMSLIVREASLPAYRQLRQRDASSTRSWPEVYGLRTEPPLVDSNPQQ